MRLYYVAAAGFIAGLVLLGAGAPGVGMSLIGVASVALFIRFVWMARD